MLLFFPPREALGAGLISPTTTTSSSSESSTTVASGCLSLGFSSASFAPSSFSLSPATSSFCPSWALAFASSFAARPFFHSSDRSSVRFRKGSRKSSLRPPYQSGLPC